MNKLLIISSVWVEPNSSAAGSRMLQLIRFFLSQNYSVEYASTATVSEFCFDLAELDITTQFIQLNDSSFDDYLRKINPNWVLFDRFMVEEQFGWRVSNVLPNAIKILDTEDLHCLRKARQEAIKNNTSFDTLDFNSEIAKREIASIYRSDLSLMVSDYETYLTGELIKQMQSDGLTLMVVEHDMTFVRQIASQVTVLHGGQVFADGNATDVLAREDVADIYLGKAV